MTGLEFGFGPLEEQFWDWVFLMTRIGAALLAAPIFGAASVPPVVRVTMTSAVAIFVLNWVPDVQRPDDLLSVSGMILVLGEVIVGLTLGMILQIAFAAPLIAAELISGAMGMSMAISADPNGGGQTTAYGQFFSIVLVLTFLTLGAHVQWLGLVVESYQTFPPGNAWLGAERIATVVAFGSTMFETAVRIALPITIILLLVQMVTGVLSRSAPSLNLFALGLPAGVLAGLGALLLSAPIIFQHFADLAETSIIQTWNVVGQ